jgi:hypothetical protein
MMPAMPRLALLPFFSLILLPLHFSAGHGAEFIQAKLSFPQPGDIKLEVAADYGDNPMLNGKDDAQSAISACLQIEVGGQWQALSALAPMTFESRAQPDPSSPMAGAKVVDGPHQLVVGVWHWQPTVPKLRFRVPKGCIHDVLLWQADVATSPMPGQWKLLIAEDTTPDIVLPRPDVTTVWITMEVVGLLLIGLVLRTLYKMDWKGDR